MLIAVFKGGGGGGHGFHRSLPANRVRGFQHLGGIAGKGQLRRSEHPGLIIHPDGHLQFFAVGVLFPAQGLGRLFLRHAPHVHMVHQHALGNGVPGYDLHLVPERRIALPPAHHHGRQKHQQRQADQGDPRPQAAALGLPGRCFPARQGVLRAALDKAPVARKRQVIREKGHPAVGSVFCLRLREGPFRLRLIRQRRERLLRRVSPGRLRQPGVPAPGKAALFRPASAPFRLGAVHQIRVGGPVLLGAEDHLLLRRRVFRLGRCASRRRQILRIGGAHGRRIVFLCQQLQMLSPGHLLLPLSGNIPDSILFYRVLNDLSIFSSKLYIFL